MNEPPDPLRNADASTPREPRGVPWRAWEGLPIWLAALLVAGLVAALIADVRVCTAHDLTPEQQAACDRALWVSLLVQDGLLLGLTLFWVRARYGASARDLGVRAPTREDVRQGVGAAFIGGIAAYVAAIVAILVWDALTPGRFTPPQQLDLRQGEAPTSMIVALGLIVVFLAPIAEEVFFRGLIYKGLRRWAAVNPAILLSAVIFGVAHFQPLFMLTTFVLGIALAIVVERRGSLAPAIIAHSLFNLVGFLLLLRAQVF